MDIAPVEVHSIPRLVGRGGLPIDASREEGHVYFKPNNGVQPSQREKLITVDEAIFRHRDGDEMLLLRIETAYDDIPPMAEPMASRRLLISLHRDEESEAWNKYRHLALLLVYQVIEKMPEQSILMDVTNLLNYTSDDKPFLYAHVLEHLPRPQLVQGPSALHMYTRISSKLPPVSPTEAYTKSVSHLKLHEEMAKNRLQHAHQQKLAVIQADVEKRHSPEVSIVQATATGPASEPGTLFDFLQARKREPGLSYEAYHRRVQKNKK